ncbi:MAG: nicotinamide riboside transporter PnuC [Muribaculaceae bacterium]|nr:nicotinamide riboside transporter PnuC [Muribaculaceae bacterium]
MSFDTILEITGFTIGLIYLYYEYHANSKMWIAGLVMPMISMWVYYSKGLYADFAMNIYYLVMAVYGYVAWTFSFRRRQKENRPVSHIAPRALLGTAAVFAAVYAALVTWLIFLTDSNVPWLDGFTTAMSIIGTWMLARKYIEQWIAWILVDIVCVGLYIYKGIYFYSALYAAYTVVAVFGYLKWRRLMAGQAA